MKNIVIKAIGLSAALLLATGTFAQKRTANYQRAEESLGTIAKLYGVPDGKNLFRETYPYDDTYSANYLGGGENEKKSNPYSYLWPFSGSLSAYVALFEQSGDPAIRKHIDDVVLPGLENYYDTRQPAAYASYVNSAPLSDRFYDDNIWLGIDFVDLFLSTKDQAYLDKAVEIWSFVASGMDDKLGGGIYWCEQRKESKNTCSNAPAVVYLLKLFQATGNKDYLSEAIALYDWTKKHLQDPDDYLYWDNINLAGKVQEAKYPYNTGQMVQAGALLYKLTKEKKYLKDAQESAAAGLTYFFERDGGGKAKSSYPRLKRSDNWFIAIMLRGYIELYHQDKDRRYIDAFKANLDYAWDDMRDNSGLFGRDWTKSVESSGKRWLLDQFAMAEMFARLAKY